MRKMIKTITLATAALGSAAVAAPIAPEARLDRLLEGRTPGKPVNCINLRDIRSTEIVDGTAIVYRVGGKLYVNRPRNADTLRRDDIMVTNSFGSQLCRIDVVRTIDRTAMFPTGFVNLGQFVPYTKN